MSRQDRQGVRTPADLERKYDFTALKDATKRANEIDLRITQIGNKVSEHDQAIQNLEQNAGGSPLQIYFQVEDGDLYLYANGADSSENFEYDEETGELFLVMEVD